jgi:hypothetical protein
MTLFYVFRIELFRSFFLLEYIRKMAKKKTKKPSKQTKQLQSQSQTVIVHANRPQRRRQRQAPPPKPHHFDGNPKPHVFFTQQYAPPPPQQSVIPSEFIEHMKELSTGFHTQSRLVKEDNDRRTNERLNRERMSSESPDEVDFRAYSRTELNKAHRDVLRKFARENYPELRTYSLAGKDGKVEPKAIVDYIISMQKEH